MDSVNVLMMKMVGPAIRTKPMMATASTMLALLSH